uniref:Uncharacterized protein n=1 Tax=Palpitomonas bilix TaxID=652834 RepID=A0A7S3D0P3_9EUKA
MVRRFGSEVEKASPWYYYLRETKESQLKKALEFDGSDIVWIDGAIRNNGTANSWGVTYNCAQFEPKLVEGVNGCGQNRNRLLGGRFPSPEPFVQRQYHRSFPGICPVITTSEGRGCGSDTRRASSFYKRKLTLAECAVRMGMPEDQIPRKWTEIDVEDMKKEGLTADLKVIRENIYRVVGTGTTVGTAVTLGKAAMLWLTRKREGKTTKEGMKEGPGFRLCRCVSTARSLQQAVDEYAKQLIQANPLDLPDAVMREWSLKVMSHPDDPQQRTTALPRPVTEAMKNILSHVFQHSDVRPSMPGKDGAGEDAFTEEHFLHSQKFDTCRKCSRDIAKDIYVSRRFCADEYGVEWVFPGVDRRWHRRKLTRGNNAVHYSRIMRVPAEVDKVAVEVGPIRDLQRKRAEAVSKKKKS